MIATIANGRRKHCGADQVETVQLFNGDIDVQIMQSGWIACDALNDEYARIVNMLNDEVELCGKNDGLVKIDLLLVQQCSKNRSMLSYGGGCLTAKSQNFVC